ncbi:hypothetical protein H8M03_02035 [Sphingomonas sabuli]|uniref:Uncharacterized protein n=1 Tax=Sphingomonas sabuli TaxID=2764186 RepID=A0A7G9L3G2_9SPHN|nr:hypothetical protein [Sphingomonas sabuli]QNM83161.1 hypothetical protein H8M03_02035 [Sphingomonas sabuli]
MGKYITGWKLPRDERRLALLDRFPPRYARTLADHVTLEAGVDARSALPRPVDARVVGHADDGESLECLVVEIDGSTERPDGSTYHVTWSLGPGRKAVESNDLLRDKGWSQLDEPVPFEVKPACFLW